MVKEAFLALALPICGCAGHVIGADDGGSQDATTESSADASDDAGIADASDDFSQCPDGGPTSCGDIGKCPGKASCCNGQYCNGYCYPLDGGGATVDVGDGICECGGMSGGCTWPTVCCHNQTCVAPTLPCP
jgi:hypothetical protein